MRTSVEFDDWLRGPFQAAGAPQFMSGRAAINRVRQRPFNLIRIVDVDIGIDHDHGLWAQITGLRAALLPVRTRLIGPPYGHIVRSSGNHS
jgi:hypothetical protein